MTTSRGSRRRYAAAYRNGRLGVERRPVNPFVRRTVVAEDLGTGGQTVTGQDGVVRRVDGELVHGLGRHACPCGYQ
ncbi:hypothetical protein ACGFZS_36330 [Streptomyces sp. NPDC048288]|uniref:hypothetical protein n=1 Tax=Streptomyces sp. NPDC048288 TaxID=3365529 RepID=UPI00371041B5